MDDEIIPDSAIILVKSEPLEHESEHHTHPFVVMPSKKRPSCKEETEGEADKEVPLATAVRIVDASAIQPIEVISEAESPSVLSIAYQISDEAVTSLKAEFKVEEDAEEMGFGSEAVSEITEKPSETEQFNSSCQCSACGIFFPKRRDLNDHMCVCTGDKPFQCPSCVKCFSSKYHLKRHSVVHTGERAYQCSICGKSFNDKSNVQQHMRVHTGEKPYQCLKCKKSFTWKTQLENHIGAHKVKSCFRCCICNMYFKNKIDMDEHTFSHIGEKPYQCLSCAKSFNSKYRLKRHSVVHTGVKAYDCNMCEKSFNDKSNLQQHMRIHTGEKPYKCSTCEQTFTWKNQLENHIPVHTNEKYYCFICHKNFKFRSSLIQHARYDLGGHRCSLCGHMFTSQEDLHSHKQAHVTEPK
ncbi:hypothetical protein B7P43_G03350 [Cryptotermes secundus]|uniref:C2H2-type domain-containing protein n=2 Tax=Cryptotermes secundus TaxID=105785 RepID=A0A2J7QXX7_9NEOP|nr:gastrula zinc finger protein XlCGF52.1 isoform X2 [Cryptotermes secundus]XP_023707792.1 gastrula zinc finger protein XlCGF52.1 isoform X2 [Cryptotermes secundus]PNF33445.1 hypothetical protein B7P43_G03350 [Cryptotermes secundus]PNF33446.1 hypothetical protein B7P43_G03350 [Cryptotermes secundus]PNF33447.1 hypothetical protein B7P43_G03350 [Cryptotermes secundus]